MPQVRNAGSETFEKADLVGIWLPGGVQVGCGVSQVLTAFMTTVATVYGNRHLQTVQLFISKRDSVSPFLEPTTRNPSNLCAP